MKTNHNTGTIVLVAACIVLQAHIGVAAHRHGSDIARGGGTVYAELSAAGTWSYTDTHAWAWCPRVALVVPGWHPFRNGGSWFASRGQRRWVSHYGWGRLVFGREGTWMMLGGVWRWVPPHTWAANLPTPPSRHICHVIEPLPPRHCRPASRYPRPNFQVTIGRSHSRSRRRVSDRGHHVSRRPSAPGHTPVAHPTPRPATRVTPVRPAPAPPPAQPRSNSEHSARSGGRLETLFRRHQGR